MRLKNLAVLTGLLIAGACSHQGVVVHHDNEAPSMNADEPLHRRVYVLVFDHSRGAFDTLAHKFDERIGDELMKRSYFVMPEQVGTNEYSSAPRFDVPAEAIVSSLFYKSEDKDELKEHEIDPATLMKMVVVLNRPLKDGRENVDVNVYRQVKGKWVRLGNTTNIRFPSDGSFKPYKKKPAQDEIVDQAVNDIIRLSLR
jgi:hypothetical protein